MPSLQPPPRSFAAVQGGPKKRNLQKAPEKGNDLHCVAPEGSVPTAESGRAVSTVGVLRRQFGSDSGSVESRSGSKTMMMTHCSSSATDHYC